MSAIAEPTEATTTGNGDFRFKGVTIDGLEDKVDIDLTFASRADEVEYSTEECIKDRLATIERNNPEDYKYVVANILLAKKVLKMEGAYKKKNAPKPEAGKKDIRGGLGAVGIENWILQNGGSFEKAARSFLEVSRTCSSLSEFQDKYAIWDFGENYMAKDKYPHDNFVYNMNEEGYKKMTHALEEYIRAISIEKGKEAEDIGVVSEPKKIEQEEDKISLVQIVQEDMNGLEDTTYKRAVESILERKSEIKVPESEIEEYQINQVANQDVKSMEGNNLEGYEQEKETKVSENKSQENQTVQMSDQDKRRMLDEILQSYVQQEESSNIGIFFAQNSSEVIGNGLRIPQNSPEVKKIEGLGYKVIYPARLKDDKVAQMDISKRKEYEARMNTALIVNPAGKRTVDLESLISRHYFQNGIEMGGMGLNYVVTRASGDFDGDYNQEYKQMLDSLGFQTTIDQNGLVTTYFDEPIHSVNETKFEQIYNESRSKVQETLKKIKEAIIRRQNKQERQNNSAEQYR